MKISAVSMGSRAKIAKKATPDEAMNMWSRKVS